MTTQNQTRANARDNLSQTAADIATGQPAAMSADRPGAATAAPQSVERAFSAFGKAEGRWILAFWRTSSPMSEAKIRLAQPRCRSLGSIHRATPTRHHISTLIALR